MGLVPPIAGQHQSIGPCAASRPPKTATPHKHPGIAVSLRRRQTEHMMDHRKRRHAIPGKSLCKTIREEIVAATAK
jgi:hypothetical protein